MSLGKWFLVVVLGIAGAVHLWHVHARSVIDHELAAAADSNGFVPVLMPDGAPPDMVLIFAALNCPAEPAQRANAMAAQLQKMGIPIQRMDHYSLANLKQDQMPLALRTNSVMGGEIPIVLLNGLGKANPSIDEVAVEYRRDK